MDDNEKNVLVYNKLDDLQQYIPFLEQVIKNLNNNDKPRPQQVQKMEMLHTLITNKDKKPLKLETLLKCEIVLKKIHNKIEKQKSDDTNSSSSPVTVVPTKVSQHLVSEIIELNEPDSPVEMHQQRYHAPPPIVIPTERRASPPYNQRFSNRQHKRNSRWNNQNQIYKSFGSENDEMNVRKRNSSLDRFRNTLNNDRLSPIHSNDNFNRDGWSNNDKRFNSDEILDGDNNYKNFERSDFNENFEIPTFSEVLKDEVAKKQNRNIDTTKFENFDNQRLHRNNEFNRFQFEQNNYTENRYFPQNIFDKPSTSRDNHCFNDEIINYKTMPQFSSWLEKYGNSNDEFLQYNQPVRERISNNFNRETFSNDNWNNQPYRETVSSQPGRNTNFSHFNKTDVERPENDNRQRELSPMWISDESLDRSHLGKLTSYDINRKKSSINQNSTVSNERSDNNKGLKNNSNIFERLGNKIDLTQNFQIQLTNEKAKRSRPETPYRKTPLIKDVLKSPPLSAHDIDELYLESGGEADLSASELDIVRRKLNKISNKTKEILNNLSTPSPLIESPIKSPDPNRLAYKYNPHPRVSLDDNLTSPKLTENFLTKPVDPRTQKQATNTLPNFKSNDPRLKSRNTENNEFNMPLKLPSSIPSLLEIQVPEFPELSKTISSVTTINTELDSLNSTDTNSHDDENLGYKKFHRILNDQSERIKYLESKKNKPLIDEPKTNNDHHRKTEKERKDRKDSQNRGYQKASESSSKNRDKNINDVEKDDKNKNNRYSKSSGKRNDHSKESKLNFNKEGEKTNRHDKEHEISERKNHKELKNVPNCLDSMYRSSNYKKDLGSVASFKIPKKCKDEEKEKSNKNVKIEEKTDGKMSNKEETISICKKDSIESLQNTLNIKEVKNKIEPTYIESNSVNENANELNENAPEQIIPKIENRRISICDKANTSDNSVISTQNIISGKRNRSIVYMNENFLQTTKKISPKKEESQTPALKLTAKTKPTKVKKQNVKKQLNETELSKKTICDTVNEDVSISCNKKDLEALFLDMFNPATNKTKIIGMLQKVLDDKKFEQIRKIIEDDNDDVENKISLDSIENVEENKNIKNELENNVDVSPPFVEDLEIEKNESSNSVKRKVKKKLTELERLNEDIRDMFISEGVVTACGRRMCTIMNSKDNNDDSSSDRTPSRQQKNLPQVTNFTKEKIDKKNKRKENNPNLKITEQTKIPQVVLVKVDISSYDKVVPKNKRPFPKRKKRGTWYKGCIGSKKNKKFASTKKDITKDSIENQLEKIEQSTNESITKCAMDEIFKEKPCPKSKKKFPISNDENLEEIVTEPNNMPNDMPILIPFTTKKCPVVEIFKDKPCPKSKKKFPISEDENLKKYTTDSNDMPILKPFTMKNCEMNEIFNDKKNINEDPLDVTNETICENLTEYDSLPVLKQVNPSQVQQFPTEEDLSDIKTLKNIYPGIHIKSEYANKCTLCKYTGIKPGNHYSTVHPAYEVFISRLPPNILNDLYDKKNNRPLYTFRKKTISVYHYQCPFCSIKLTLSRTSWIDHFSTHTGEHYFKCSLCLRSMNLKKSITKHLANSCKTGEIITRPRMNRDFSIIEAFVCTLCNYIQMVKQNLEKHLKTQHDIKSSGLNKYKRIILIDITNIPLLSDFEEEQHKQLTNFSQELTPPITNHNNDAFMPNDQNDLNIDKKFLNYMSEMSFSSAESNVNNSKSPMKSSIVDQLSERLQSVNSENINSPDVPAKCSTPIQRRFSIADQLNKRFKTVDHNNDDENTNNSIENILENNDGSNSPMPVVYILDCLDEDINNVELTESNEQIIVPVDKPISAARANQLNEMMNENHDLKKSNSSTIIARLNERFKSPQKSQEINKSREIIHQKSHNSKSGVMIIDRLNKRLNSIDGREKPLNLLLDKPINDDLLQEISLSSHNPVENCESDDNLVIDESRSEILNELTGNFEISSETETDKNRNLTTLSNETENVIHIDEDNADDDDWEDIEIMPSKELLNDSKTSENSGKDKDTNKTILQTLSRLYNSIVPKSKSISTIQQQTNLPKYNSTSLVKIAVKKNAEKQVSIDVDSNDEKLTNVSPTFFNYSSELSIDPSVPLSSEPLSDLNDISEILEPSSSNSNDNNLINDQSSRLLGSPIDLNNINDELFTLNNEASLEDALALAVEMETSGEDLEKNQALDEIPFFFNEKLEEIISDPLQLITTTQLIPSTKGSSSTIMQIQNMGFSKSNKTIKYLCLVKSCSFLYSEMSIGLQNHYDVDHPELKWNGSCSICNNVASIEAKELQISQEIKHMTEIHMNEKAAVNNLTFVPSKPKISLRRLSGDLLSVKPSKNQSIENDDVNSTNSCNDVLLSAKEQKPTTSISQQKITILNLLNKPSIPPPLPSPAIKNITNNNAIKTPPVVLNRTLCKNRTFTKNLVLKITSRGKSPVLEVNKDKSTEIKSYGNKVLKNVSNSLNEKNSITNNILGGSNLLISSVSESVILPKPAETSTTLTNLPSTSTTSSTLKIQNVYSLNTKLHKTKELITQKINSLITTAEQQISILETTLLSPKKSLVTTENQNSTDINRIQVWIQSNDIKKNYYADLQLRPISLFAKYKCMNAECLFTTNCSDKFKIHLYCHESSGNETCDWLKCSYCSFDGIKSDNLLLAHLDDVHKNDIFQCPYCFYRSCCECNVQQHLMIYHKDKKLLINVTFGERKKIALEIKALAKNRVKYVKPIGCNECPKKFYIVDNYFQHLRSVHYLKNLDVGECAICYKQGIVKKTTSRHLSIVHNISMYQCIYCPESFIARSGISLHMTNDHSSNLIYCCVRVSPNKSMAITDETIENSTILANLTDINKCTITPCPFTIDQLNYMSPYLDEKSILDNCNSPNILTELKSPIGDKNDEKLSPEETKSPKTNQIEDINTTDLSTSNSSNNNTLGAIGIIIDTNATHSSDSNRNILQQVQPLKSPNTIKISSILNSCNNLITTSSTTFGTINVPNSNQDSLFDRIIQAAKSLVQDTGFEGHELFRCASVDCVNIELTEENFIQHCQNIHARLRMLNCPHCTSQYQLPKVLCQHLHTHRRHCHFCYFCNYTSNVLPQMQKHIKDMHTKVICSTLLFPRQNRIEYDNSFKDSDEFFVSCPKKTNKIDIEAFGKRLIRICERKKSLSKNSFKPEDINMLPMQSIFHHEVICAKCSYKTKVRINMYRHLLYHTREIAVPVIDPINPVPCLINNEKNYDKMINLAYSSNDNSISNNTTSNKTQQNPSALNEKKDFIIPTYIMPMKRYVCGVSSCNYLTINDNMLRCHLSTLHSSEKSYKCPHCKVELVNKGFNLELIIRHLKFHDSKLFLCSECSYMHYQHNVIDRHISEKHPNIRNNIEIIMHNRQETTSTVSIYNSINGKNNENNSTSNQTPLNTPVNSPVNTTTIDNDMNWECTICKQQTNSLSEMNNHVNIIHNIRFRYACLHCKFGACQFNNVMEHISEKHRTKARRIKCAFNRIDEVPATAQVDFLQQDNRPLWSRDDPQRIKNIRGILMEDDYDEEVLKINQTPTTTKNNNNNKKSKPKIKAVAVDNKPTKNSNNQNSLIEKINSSISDVPETKTNECYIFECSFCLFKNISLNSVASHWQTKHNINNSDQIFSQPFSFKIFGHIDHDLNEIKFTTFKVEHLIELKNIGVSTTRFQCNKCWRLYSNLEKVIEHQNVDHKKQNGARCLQFKNKIFHICNFCGFASSLQSKTAAHLLNHYSGFKNCEHCNLKFDKFLDFVNHLSNHEISLKDCIENNAEILTFWNRIKVFHPNGLCIERKYLPISKSENKILEEMVITEIKVAIDTKKNSEIESNTEIIKSPSSSGEETVPNLTKRKLIDEDNLPLKRTKNNEDVEIIVDVESLSSENLINNNSESPKHEPGPKHKPGPKCMQQKPYSFYGMPQVKIDLTKIFTSMIVFNSPVVVNCECFRTLVNIEPRVYVEKINLNKFNYNNSSIKPTAPVQTYKRKLSQIINNIIDEQFEKSTKKIKDSV